MVIGWYILYRLSCIVYEMAYDMLNHGTLDI
jgi:hypothetical protein